eukprot:2596066-Rhodomonas_salina.5
MSELQCWLPCRLAAGAWQRQQTLRACEAQLRCGIKDKNLNAQISHSAFQKSWCGSWHFKADSRISPCALRLRVQRCQCCTASSLGLSGP